jgi:hypothetical protein
MKKIFLLLLILALLSSCKKENPIPESKEYESEIFSGQDTLIYGEWKYLYSYGGWAGSRIDKDISILSIKPIGKFVLISKKNEVTKGIISILGEEHDRTKIVFLEDSQNGIKKTRGFPESIYFSHPDTLNLVEPCCDMYSNYYARIK